MDALIEASDWPGLVRHLEEHEMALLTQGVAVPVDIYTSLMLAYLIVDDCEAAKALWSRAPPDAKANAALERLFFAHCARARNEFAAVYPILDAAGVYPAPLAHAARAALRRRVARLLASAYSVLRVADAAAALGFGAATADAVAFCASADGGAWTVDAADAAYLLASAQTHALLDADAAGDAPRDSLQTLERIEQAILHLES